MRKIMVLATGVMTAISSSLAAQPDRAEGTPAPQEPRSVTLPFKLDHNRMIVEVRFLRPDGKPRRARAWVDTGNPQLVLAATLAADLGVEVDPDAQAPEGHSRAALSPAPPLELEGLRLHLDGVGVRVHPGSHVRPGVAAETNLPASALLGSHVVFDYAQRHITVARPGVLKPRGLAVPCRVNADTGLFQVTAIIDGQAVELGIDNGSAGTWVSQDLVKTWRSHHRDLTVAIGAVGSTNFFGFDFEAAGTLLRLPELRLGTLQVGDIALLGLPQGLFDWYSRKSAGTVAGFLGANVLRRFRLEVDYPNRMTYWEETVPDVSGDLDIVGLTLRPESDGSFSVAGVTSRGGVPTVPGVEAGDRLLRVDGLTVTGQLMGTVVDALRGAPGTRHSVAVQRDGETIEVEATVVRFP